MVNKITNHQQLAKGGPPDGESQSHHRTLMSISRSIGHEGSWVGLGKIDKSLVDVDHHDFICPFFSLVYVHQGLGSYTDDRGKRYELNSGSIFFRKPGVCHSTSVNTAQPWIEYYLDLSPAVYRYCCDMGLLDDTQWVVDTSISATAEARFLQLMAALQACNEIELGRVTLDILQFAYDMCQTDKTLVDDPSQIMVQQAMEEFSKSCHVRFELQEYCRVRAWGYERFRKRFRQYTGMSPSAYILRCRMNEAIHLLRNSPLRISEISLQLGYASQAEFSKQFKRQMGVFPKAFRMLEQESIGQ